MSDLFGLAEPVIGDISATMAALLWSVSVILMRIAGYQIQAIPLNIFKNTVAILGFFIVILITGAPLHVDLTTNEWLMMVGSGVLGIAIADVLFLAALNRLGASLQAIVDCVYAPSIIVTAFILFDETIGIVELIGGSMIGTAVVVGAKNTAEVRSKKDLYLGLSMGVVSHVLMAVGALMIRDIYREHSVAWVCFYRFLIANGLLLGWAYMTGFGQNPLIAFKLPKTWKYTIPSALLGAFLATIFWLSGFKYQVAGRAAIYNQLASVFIALLAILVLKEKVTFRKAVSIGLGIAGALLISW